MFDFANEISDEGNPICPVDNKPVYPNHVVSHDGRKGELVRSTESDLLLIVHRECQAVWNNRALGG